jgi:5-methylcytosine-specific restriction endonuclease McrA
VSERDLIFDLTCLQKRSARKKFRRQILDEWGSCAYCGRSKPSTLDHVVPKARGGKTIKENLIAACGACNLEKSSQSWFEWYRAQDFWSAEREDRILRWVNQPQILPPVLVPTPWAQQLLPLTA